MFAEGDMEKGGWINFGIHQGISWFFLKMSNMDLIHLNNCENTKYFKALQWI